LAPLKIAITVDPEIPVPPQLYGGIERIVSMLIDSYVKMGHEVVLFAHKDSKVNCLLMPYPSTGYNAISTLKNTVFVTKHIYFNNFDMIHSFSRLAYLMFLFPISIPKLMSYQREPTISQIQKAVRIAKRSSLSFTGCSNYISEQISPFAPSYTVYNGVDLSKYKFENSVSDDAPLVFLGRIEPIKGTDIAIEVAVKSGRKLIIAGNIPTEYQNYFDDQIKPKLNSNIQYIGPINDEQKNILLGKAYAFLMPIKWNEPFGIVMVEAMACGTPVIGFRRGSVPEVVVHGVNGFICETTIEMIELVNKVNKIKRSDVRIDVEQRFSSNVIANDYLKIYERVRNKK
jgi:glycosyltransferase involved in cell wall biosynthesis